MGLAVTASNCKISGVPKTKTQTITKARSRAAATQGPRVNLTLTVEMDRVLERIARASGTGKATFVREVLSASLPQLDQIATALEQVQARDLPDALGTVAKLLRSSAVDLQQGELELTRVRRQVRRKSREQAK